MIGDLGPCQIKDSGAILKEPYDDSKLADLLWKGLDWAEIAVPLPETPEQRYRDNYDRIFGNKDG